MIGMIAPANPLGEPLGLKEHFDVFGECLRRKTCNIFSSLLLSLHQLALNAFSPWDATSLSKDFFQRASFFVFLLFNRKKKIHSKK